MRRHTKLYNRIAFVAAIWLAIVLPCACGQPRRKTGPVKTQAGADSLTILDWAGYDAPEFWTQFAQAYPM